MSAIRHGAAWLDHLGRRIAELQPSQHPQATVAVRVAGSEAEARRWRRELEAGGAPGRGET